MESCVNVCVHKKGGKIHPLQKKCVEWVSFSQCLFLCVNWVFESPQKLCGMGIIFTDIFHPIRPVSNFDGRAGYATFSSSRPPGLCIWCDVTTSCTVTEERQVARVGERSKDTIIMTDNDSDMTHTPSVMRVRECLGVFIVTCLPESEVDVSHVGFCRNEIVVEGAIQEN